MRRLLAGFVLVVLAALVWVLLATERGLDLPPAGSLPAPPAHDFASESEELASDLQAYLRLNTVRGHERPAAEFLRERLAREGIEARILDVPGAPERANLVAELPGKQPDHGLVLANHLDTVEANAAEWAHDPFAGIREGDRIHGRGAVDMKGMGIMQLHAFIALKKSGIPLPRRVMFLALADEESGGVQGAHLMLGQHEELFRGYDTMLNEGGIGTRGVVAPGATMFNVQYAEKGVLWLKTRASGTSGHGSTPPNRYASRDLLDFLDAVNAMETSYTITDEAAQFFSQLSLATPFPNSFFLRRSRHPLVKPLLSGAIDSNRHLRAMTSNTRSITGLRTGTDAVNVISDAAEASLDVRLLPGVDPAQYLAKLKALAEPHGVTLEVVHEDPPTSSPVDDPLFRTIAAVATRAVPGSVATPFLSPGGTDSSLFRRHGFHCYGLIPAVIEAGELDGIHGKDESLTVPNLVLGTRIVFETVAALEQ